LHFIARELRKHVTILEQEIAALEQLSSPIVPAPTWPISATRRPNP
jgi:hypothetical protein